MIQRSGDWGRKIGWLTAVWLAERVRDVGLWPLNLFRDGPKRLRRLGHTILAGWREVIHFKSAFQEARQQQNLRVYGYESAQKCVFGLHLLLAHLFDLVGGPEIAQFFLHLFTFTKPLTDHEITQMQTVLAPASLRYEDIRVAEGGLYDWLFRLNGGLAFATWHTVNFPRNGRYTRANLPILVHELSHVYQYEQVGSRYLGEAIYQLWQLKQACYQYGGVLGLQQANQVGQSYATFNREQQAQIVQDFYTRQSQGKDVSVYEPLMAQCREGEL